jgi:hypothetical protein
VAGVIEVLEAYGTQLANLRRAAFRGSFDGRDGFTLSLWRSDERMRQAAYQSGTHRDRINEDKAGLLSDRTSFTRLRVLRSLGRLGRRGRLDTSVTVSVHQRPLMIAPAGVWCNALDRVLPQVSERDSLTSANRYARLLDATQKLGVMLKPILEPILFRRKADQDTGRTTVPCDHDFFVGCEPQILGKVILHFRQRHFLYALALASPVR